MGKTGPSSSKAPLLRSVRRITLALVAVMLVLTCLAAWPAIDARRSTQEGSTGAGAALVTTTPTGLPTPSLSPTLPPTASQTTEPTAAQPQATDNPFTGLSSFGQGTIVAAMGEGGYTHLFAYQPQSLALTRLTQGAWSDITPAFSPDGSRLAFSSNRSGHYDLYVMEIAGGEITRLTDTPEYEASPAWSPDGEWLAYEAYLPGDEESGNLEIFVRPVNGGQAPLQLTNHPAADFFPAWSPLGRQIAYVSNSSGEQEIWLADLDRIDDRFSNLSHSPTAPESAPAWSPDGTRLAWSTLVDGVQTMVVWNPAAPGSAPQPVGSGSLAAWSPDGQALFAAFATPNRWYISGYPVVQNGLALPALSSPGRVAGLAWSRAALPQALAQPPAEASPTPLWQAEITPMIDGPAGRFRIVPLADVQAPSPLLQDRVDEAFRALRERSAAAVGWDFLSSLENAYVPLTAPLSPGMQDDWLYTGRAFAFNTLPMNAGWLVVVREDYASQTYWRVFLRARFQDGSQGAPLTQAPWNFNARYLGDPRSYEDGGALAQSIPGGYWIDFTQLAADYGWQRVPALVTWRSAYTAARFNEFVLTDGWDWFGSMLEIYPKEALDTPTPIPTATLTPTATRRPTRTPWPTRTPAPTRTPWPTKTSTPTRTPSITPTAAP